MAYIGKSPTGTGVRSRFYYTQTSGGGTSISGTDDNSKTLTFTDGEYIDVFLNGVLLVAGTDYNTNTANTISGLAALANGDVVEVVVYDIFTVADTVSASQGGTFNSSVTVNRPSSDGDVIIIQKDGTQTGAITTNGDDTVEIYGEGSAKTGLRFGGSSLIPLKNAGALSDNGVDLGTSSYRFNDAYLGGDLYIGGTGSANALDEYEEGTWTPAIYYQNSDDQTNSNNDIQSGTYRKVGKLVVATCMLQWDATDARANDNIGVSGFPFNAMASPPDNETRWTTNITMKNTSFAANDGPVGIMVAPSGALGTFIKANTSTANLGDQFGQNTNMIVRFTLSYHTD